MQYVVLASSCNSIKKEQPNVLNESIVAEVAVVKMEKVQDVQTRDIILRVLKICKEECSKQQLHLPLASLHSRVAMYAGVADRTVTNVKKEGLRFKTCEQSQSTFRKNIRKRTYKTVLDDRDMIRIKSFIQDYYIKYRKVPAVRSISPLVCDQIPTWKTGSSFLSRVLETIGFKRRKFHSKRSVLIEDPTQIAHRSDYLTRMKELRSNLENVFYVYECVIDKSFTLHKSWVQMHGCVRALRDTCTFSIICAGSINGFQRNSILMTRNAIEKTGNKYVGQLSVPNFNKWLKTYLIPNLPQNSVIIMDDGPHHCEQQEEPVSYYTSKSSMCEYLKCKNIECNENMRRSELYKLVEMHKSKHKLYIVDSILNEHQHKVMRLPSYMVDLNPVQHAMDMVQQKLIDNEPTAEFNLKNIGEIMGKLMSSITSKDWEDIFKKVVNLEDEIWNKDKEYEVALDEVMLNLRDCLENESAKESDFDSDIEDLEI